MKNSEIKLEFLIFLIKERIGNLANEIEQKEKGFTDYGFRFQMKKEKEFLEFTLNQLNEIDAETDRKHR